MKMTNVKMTNVLVMAGILCIGNMLMGEDKILFDGQTPWSNTEIKVDPDPEFLSGICGKGGL
jgi:hypothetical protein